MAGKSNPKVPKKHMPEVYYHKLGQFQYIKFDEIPLAQKYRDEFSKWMEHQTCGVVEEDGKQIAAIYVDDYVRWYLMRFAGKETYWD